MAAAPNELSFLPDDYLERKARRRTNAICAVLFCVVISAIGGAFTVTERSMREIEDQYAAVQQQYTDAAKRIEQVQQMQEKQRKMAQQAELTAGLLEKVPRSFVLAELTNGMPTGVSLLDFRLESTILASAPSRPKTAFEIRQAQVTAAAQPGAVIAAAPQAKNYDVMMRLNGVALTVEQVGDFLGLLGKSRMFNDVNLISTEEFKQPENPDAKLRKFAIEMKLNPAATVDLASAPAKLGEGGTKTAGVSLEK
jgi:Tfp pilus assembly protein PilN